MQHILNEKNAFKKLVKLEDYLFDKYFKQGKKTRFFFFENIDKQQLMTDLSLIFNATKDINEYFEWLFEGHEPVKNGNTNTNIIESSENINNIIGNYNHIVINANQISASEIKQLRDETEKLKQFIARQDKFIYELINKTQKQIL